VSPSLQRIDRGAARRPNRARARLPPPKHRAERLAHCDELADAAEPDARRRIVGRRISPNVATRRRERHPFEGAPLRRAAPAAPSMSFRLNPAQRTERFAFRTAADAALGTSNRRIEVIALESLLGCALVR